MPLTINATKSIPKVRDLRNFLEILSSKIYFHLIRIRQYKKFNSKKFSNMVVQTTLREMSCSCMYICCEIGKLKKTKKKRRKRKKKKGLSFWCFAHEWWISKFNWWRQNVNLCTASIKTKHYEFEFYVCLSGIWTQGLKIPLKVI